MGLREPHRSSEPREGRAALAVAAAFALIATLAGADLLSDLAEGTTLFHAVVEGGVVLLGLVGVLFTGRRFAALRRRERRLAEEAADLAGRLEQSRAEAARWRVEAADLLRGLGASIDQQFDRWQLTPAEKEVALLLLKGLSLKELASVREVADATARQQARAVYRKAGLAGRSELSAFFLEDLLLPSSRADS